MTTKDKALKLALETSEGIVNADWRKWDELASPSEFERWAKSRANFMATILREALAEQPAQQEPEQSKIFCGVDFADGMLSVFVLRRRADDVAELLHAEQIELPAQRTWVGLTEQEAAECWSTSTVRTWQAIEAKLKDKNNG